MFRFVIILLVTFIAMEFFSYFVHRFVYHGFAWSIHKSHHTPRKGAFELNDIFPTIFALITVIVILYALRAPFGLDLLAVGIGSTAYGIVYFFIHDLYVHRRVKRFSAKIALLKKVKQAHAIHHRYGGEPYGLLLFSNPRKMAGEIVDEAEPV